MSRAVILCEDPLPQLAIELGHAVPTFQNPTSTKVTTLWLKPAMRLSGEAAVREEVALAVG